MDPSLYISWCLIQFTLLKVLLWFHFESTSAILYFFHWKKFWWLWVLSVLFSLFFAQCLHLQKFNPDQVISILKQILAIMQTNNFHLSKVCLWTLFFCSSSFILSADGGIIIYPYCVLTLKILSTRGFELNVTA